MSDERRPTPADPPSRATPPADAPPRTARRRPPTRGGAPRSGTPRRPPAAPAGEAVSRRGVLRVHPRGFGFVDLAAPVLSPEHEPVTSCFVPPPMVEGLLADDAVDVTLVVEADGRGTATAVALRERARTVLYGVVTGSSATGLAMRPDPHVAHGTWTLQGRVDGVAPGQAVLADVTGARTADPTDVWDDPLWPDALLGRVLARHRIDEQPPVLPAEPVEPAEGPPRGRRRKDPVPRRDLRAQTTFTIDAPSSRDLDDALSVQPADDDGGLRVSVHISDVAAHLPAGSPLDEQARRAGTSVYLPDWTRPMLPPELSEDALSLVPDEDRDVLTVELRLAGDGEVTAADVYASRIRSTMRLSYEQAAEVLAGRTPADVPGEVVDALRWLRTAAARLGVQRLRRGGVEARRVEPEYTVRVRDGLPVTVAATPSNPANLLIERLMVAANEAVAGWLVDRGLPGMFRVHPAPGAEAAPALEAFCAAAGYHPGFGETLTPLSLAALSAQLDLAADDTATAVWDVLLGFLGRASYTPVAGPHFGLASQSYLHFTSPIRRYADLTVHRVIRAFLAGARGPQDFPGREEMSSIAEHLNLVSGSAARAEREMRKALWLVQLAEQAAAEPERDLRGRVTGLSAKGAFVTLDGSLVSGMLNVRTLPGRGWRLSDDGLELRSAGRHALRYGDVVCVRVASADVEAGQLELGPGGGWPQDAPRQGRPPRRAD
jgi:ribonuclease R